VGGSATAGGAGGAAGSGAQIDPAFKLLWRDEFDTFDPNRWATATHTFPENLARFSAANALVEDGLLKLRVSNVPSGDKPYSAAEVLTQREFTFGRFEGRIKFCAGSGMVSSLFTYKEDVNESWQEIDIEHLGNLPKSIQYNLISGSLNSRKYQPKVVALPYAPPSEFHDYALEWRPDGVTFYVDGVQSHQDVQATLQDAAHLHMNVWPTDNAVTSFAGPLDPDAIPCEAQYDWVAAYSYEP
jgi:beta-glucanase (GH16 family)